jgi:hypothetical protein
MPTDAQRQANREKWKKDSGAYFEYLRDTMYDHQQIADELARDERLEPKDRLRALADYVKIAKDIIASLHVEDDDGPSEGRPTVEARAKRGKSARAGSGQSAKTPAAAGVVERP